MRRPDIPTAGTATIEIPVQFSRLRDLAYNLWWTWSPLARTLFRMVDPLRWQHYRNPIELLIDLEPHRWHELQKDDAFIRAYRVVIEKFDRYIVPEKPTWFDREYRGYDAGPIAYFSTEFGWHECLQIYSGGLGVLSGDHTKTASDLGLPFVGVGLIYRHGYFRQTVDADGQQQHFYPDYDLHRLPLLPVTGALGQELLVPLELPGRTVQLRVWKADVGRVPVLLLDTDVADNHPADRTITSVLYVRGREMRLCQELVLGLGGAKVLATLGIAPAVWHQNEGHSALLSLARLPGEGGAQDLDAACRELSRSTVFTTHTPVPAGNESFDDELVRKYLGDWAQRNGFDTDRVLALGRDPRSDDNSFNLTVLALRTSGRANGVSKLHGDVANGMWKGLLDSANKPPIEHVTNGVHVWTWLGRPVGDMMLRHLGPNLGERLLESGFEESVQRIPDIEVWQAHRDQKQRLVEWVRERSLEQQARHGRSPDELRQLDGVMDPDHLVIGFARRFATYKRADLILRDIERLRRMVGSTDRPIQFVFAGKAHPADKPGQDLIRKIWQASADPELSGRVIFLENYDMRAGRILVQGVDVWLNNPRRPLEASGTSGMKVALNGGLNASILDGWWCEGYDPSHGWMIGEAEAHGSEAEQDDRDANAMYEVLDDVARQFYTRNDAGLPLEWIARMKHAIAKLTPMFCSARMVRQYTENLYLPAAGAAVGKDDSGVPSSR